MRRMARYGLCSVMLAWCLSAEAAEGSIETEPGVHIRYVEQGVAAGEPTVMLVPGWGFAAEIWEGQMQALGGKRRVIAIDPRSQGDSTKTASGNTPEVRARDIERIMVGLDVREAVLVGWSQGVQDVISHASQFGADRVAGYVLVDSMASSGPALVAENPQAAQQLLARLGIYSTHQKPYLEGMMRAVFAQPLDATRADRYVASAMRTPATIGMAMLVADLLTVDRRPYLRTLTRPTLIVASANAEDLEAQRSMLRELPQARIVEIGQAGHAVFVDQPEKFNAELLSFIEQLSSTDGNGSAWRHE